LKSGLLASHLKLFKLLVIFAYLLSCAPVPHRVNLVKMT
jgi:hypothetical protein